ncbi:hypothetical protein [Succinimonas sp.]|uniref:hypothetical protein n=1 Tax=Succinimonas sp. TaxID=1936151 RepID=UPI00386EFB85
MPPDREPDLEPYVGSCENNSHKACEEQFNRSNKRRSDGSDKCSDAAVDPAETEEHSNTGGRWIKRAGEAIFAIGAAGVAIKLYDAIAHPGSKCDEIFQVTDVISGPENGSKVEVTDEIEHKRERDFLELIHLLAVAAEKIDKKQPHGDANSMVDGSYQEIPE